MTLYTSTWGERKTFRLMPFTADCPYLEGIFDVETQRLVFIMKDKKETFHMLAKLDEQGDPVRPKKPRVNLKPYAEERKTLETYQEHYYTEKEEIERLVSIIAENADSFNFKQYITGELYVPEKPNISLITP